MNNFIENKNAKDFVPTKASTQNIDIDSVESTQNVDKETTQNLDIDSVESTVAEFNRSTVEALGNDVRLTDTDEASGLELFCYVKCGAEDDDNIKKCRGVVFHKDTIVMNAFPYTIEFSHSDEKQIIEQIQPIFKDSIIFDAHEGTLIRMFYFDGKWYTTTHRKLNAFRSRWASKESFGTSFKRALEAEVENNKILRDSIPEDGDGLLERFQSTLDITKKYMFLIRHNEENRIVCAPPTRPTLYHVGTFVNDNLVMSENINIPYPTKHTFLNIHDLIKHVSKVDIRNIQGVIIFAPNNCQYKIINMNYLDLSNARGNEPSIKYRYLQVRMQKPMVDMLYHLYPEMIKTFELYENTIYSIAKNIYTSYVQRFIKKKWVTVAGEEFNVIRACHSWHENDRKVNRITIEKVIEILNEQSPTNINKMIRHFHNEKVHQQETQVNIQQRNRSNTVTSSTEVIANNLMTVASPLLLAMNRNNRNNFNTTTETSVIETEFDEFNLS